MNSTRNRTHSRLAVVLGVFLAAGVVTHVPAYAAVVSLTYDFSSATGISTSPGANLHNNDSWSVSGGVPSNAAVLSSSLVTGLSGNHGYTSSAGTKIASRPVTLANDPILTSMTLGYNIRARTSNDYLFGLADGGFAGEVGPLFGLVNGDWVIQEADGGTSNTVASGLTTAQLGFYVQLDIDLTANGGDGSGSLSVQDLTTPGSLTPVAGLQNINLGILDMDGVSSNPFTWDSLYVAYGGSGGGASFDSLALEITSVPEPQTLGLAALGLLGVMVLMRRKLIG